MAVGLGVIAKVEFLALQLLGRTLALEGSDNAEGSVGTGREEGQSLDLPLGGGNL